ncbi:MAG: 3TM-type holin [Alphaproteobacteria bacterium]
MLSALLSKIGLPVFIRILSSVLGQIDTPVTRGAAEALDKVDEAIKGGHISPAQMIEANRHAEKMAEIELQNVQSVTTEVNETMRAEITSGDMYVRRMRPTFGYLMAFTWAAQMFGIAYVIVFDTGKAGFVVNAMSNLSAIWAMGLSVLGIYVYKRSEEKKTAVQGPDMIAWNKSKGS